VKVLDIKIGSGVISVCLAEEQAAAQIVALTFPLLGM
jgi:methylase of polypeptide subunit release factors